MGTYKLADVYMRRQGYQGKWLVGQTGLGI